MSRFLKAGLLILFCVLLSIPAQAGLARVAKRYTYVDFYGGYSSPIGGYQGIGVIDFENSRGQTVELEADEVYDPTFHVGFNYGQLRNNRMQLAIGFRYTKINQQDRFMAEDQVLAFAPEKPSINQFDIEFDFNYLLTNITETWVAPYGGVGVRGGLTAFSAEGVETESEINLGVSLNFGAEVKLWQNPGRGFVTFASVNSYDFWATGEKPRFLNLGGAVKYYFSM